MMKLIMARIGVCRYPPDDLAHPVSQKQLGFRMPEIGIFLLLKNFSARK